MCILKYPSTRHCRQTGTALILTVFIVALLSAVVMGLLQVNTMDIQVMQNQVYAVEAQMVAQAGLEDAVAQLRLDSDWKDGFENKAFNGGTYTVDVSTKEIVATGTSAQGFTRVVAAEFTALLGSPPHEIRLGALRINKD